MENRHDGQVQWWSRTMVAACLHRGGRDLATRMDFLGLWRQAASHAGGAETICKPTICQALTCALHIGMCVCLGEDRWKFGCPLPTERSREGNDRQKRECRGMLVAFQGVFRIPASCDFPLEDSGSHHRGWAQLGSAPCQLTQTTACCSCWASSDLALKKAVPFPCL